MVLDDPDHIAKAEKIELVIEEGYWSRQGISGKGAEFLLILAATLPNSSLLATPYFLQVM
jgi:hypothetical protein